MKRLKRSSPDNWFANQESVAERIAEIIRREFLSSSEFPRIRTTEIYEKHIYSEGPFWKRNYGIINGGDANSLIIDPQKGILSVPKRWIFTKKSIVRERERFF